METSNRKKKVSKHKYQIPTYGKRRALCFDVGIRHFATAIVTLDGDNDFEIEYLNCSDIVKDSGSQVSNCMKIPARIIMQYTMNHLLENVHNLLKEKPDIIVIEQQAEKGTKFKGIGIVVQSFFYLYYKLKKEEPPPIVFQSGSQKLKIIMEVEENNGLNVTPAPKPINTKSKAIIGSTFEKKSKSSYKQWKENKNYSESHFAVFLDSYSKCRKWLHYYYSLEKKDDVADAAFHAVFVLCVGNTRLPKNHPGIIKLKGDGISSEHKNYFCTTSVGTLKEELIDSIDENEIIDSTRENNNRNYPEHKNLLQAISQKNEESSEKSESSDDDKNMEINYYFHNDSHLICKERKKK